MSERLSHIEIIDHGSTINAYEDKPNGRILAVASRPRVYTGASWVITVPRTGQKIERNYFVKEALQRVAHKEYLAINPE